MLAFSLTHPDSATHTGPLKGPKRPPHASPSETIAE
ncbi:hypothetical protein FHU43_3397 [Halopolyspora algeriensis]|nr:hypothetical protein FHU43_3397 [Halopolyspora algeriensis]